MAKKLSIKKVDIVGTLTTGSPTVTGIGPSFITQLVVGDPIYGTGIPSGTKIKTIDVIGGSITLGNAANADVNATASGSQTLTVMTDDIIVKKAERLNTAVTINGVSFDGSENVTITTEALTASAALDLIKTVDGSGSGLDADLLDGNDSTYFASKDYVESLVASGIHFHQPVRAATTASLSVIYDNGTSGVGATLTADTNSVFTTLDGVTNWSTGQRILIKNQTNAFQNGVYTLTSLGSTGVSPWVLTRATDANTYEFASPDGLSEGSTFFVQSGTVNAGSTFTVNTTGTIIFGTTNIVFSQVSTAQIYSAGDGLTLTGTEFSVDTNRVVTRDVNGNITATSAGLTFIDLDTTPGAVDNTVAGRIFYNEDEDTVNIVHTTGTVHPIGHKFYIAPVRNNSGVVIPLGTFVMATGASGDQISVAKAVTNGTVSGMFMLGFASTSFPIDSEYQKVVTDGLIRNINTNAWPVGTILYPDPATPGGVTSAVPTAPAIKTPVAIVIKQSTSAGIIYVRMITGSRLGETDDNVEFVSLVDKQMIAYNGANSRWENTTNLSYDFANSRLGIGTMSPSNSLHIRGPVGNLIGTSGSLLISTVDTGTSALNARGAGITFTQLWEAASPNSSIRTGAIYGLKTTGNGVFGGGLAFYSQPQADVNMVESMRINNLGLVGIGETTLAAQLQVKSGATTRVPLIVDTLASHTATLQEWKINGNNVAYLTNGGRFISSLGISFTTANEASINFASTGTTISRNINDANTALKVQISDTSSTANIQEWWSNISGTTALRASLTKNGSLIANNLTLSGDLTVNGTVTTLDTQTVNIKDNLILINSNQTGTPSSLLEGGIEVERGDLTNYKFVFAEATTDFRIGQTGDLQAVATRQDAPTSNGIAFWNNTAKRFDTSSGLTVNSSGNLIDARITNSAVGVSPLIVNGITGTTAPLQEWQVNNGILTYIASNGVLRSANGIANSTVFNNSYVNVATIGTLIERNIADANHALRVNLANASSTGDILRLQFAGANKLEVTKDGWLNQNGEKFLHETGGNADSNIALGYQALNVNSTGSNNTVMGYQALISNNSNYNTGIGFMSLRETTGDSNTAVGNSSGRNITTGRLNTFIGMSAGENGAWGTQLATAQNSTAIGNQAFTDKSNQMVFGNNAMTEYLFGRNTTSAVKIGIGTATANLGGFGNELTISGSGFTSEPEAFINLQGSRTTDVNVGGMNFYNLTNRLGRMTVRRSGADSSGRFAFFTSNSGTETEKMTIMPDGKVGIGISNPSHTLDITSASNDYVRTRTTNADTTTGYIMTNDARTWVVRVHGADGDKFQIRDATADIQRLTIDSSGNVGIGTTSPARELDVSGRIRITHTADNALDFVRTGANTYTIEHDANKFYLYNSTTVSSPFIVMNSGNISINAGSSPTAQLQVKSGATDRVPLIVDTLSGQTNPLQIWRINGSDVGYIDNGANLRFARLGNSASLDNSAVNTATTGTIISRNIADANDALTVNLVHASSTGLILDAQAAGTTKASIEKDGSVNTTARFKYGSNAYTEYNATDNSIDFVFAS